MSNSVENAKLAILKQLSNTGWDGIMEKYVNSKTITEVLNQIKLENKEPQYLIKTWFRSFTYCSPEKVRAIFFIPALDPFSKDKDYLIEKLALTLIDALLKEKEISEEDARFLINQSNVEKMEYLHSKGFLFINISRLGLKEENEAERIQKSNSFFRYISICNELKCVFMGFIGCPNICEPGIRTLIKEHKTGRCDYPIRYDLISESIDTDLESNSWNDNMLFSDAILKS